MSFGFSIGDIVLLSKLAYDLYSSVSSGRKAASRDLQELESVLFSLRCALDHLGDVSKDVLAQADHSYGGARFAEKLNRMMTSCAATLQELDDVTKKYREIGIDAEEEVMMEGNKKKLTLGDAKKIMKVNWKKIRWDQEKQSLQSYREKLRSHTDAITVIVTSATWSKLENSEAKNKSSHKRTQELIGKVLQNPQVDPNMLQLLQEIHAFLITPSSPVLQVQSHTQLSLPRLTLPTPVPGGVDDLDDATPFSTGSPPMVSRTIEVRSLRTPVIFRPVSISDRAVCTSDAPEVAVLSNQLAMGAHMDSFMYSDPTFKPARQPSLDKEPDPKLSIYRYEIEQQNKAKEASVNLLTPSINKLNIKRRAVAVKEFMAYKEMHGRLLDSRKQQTRVPPRQNTAEIVRIKHHLAEIFRPIENSGTNHARMASKARVEEIVRWIDEFTEFVKNSGKDDVLIDTLVTLNEAIENSNSKAKIAFYAAADQAGFLEALAGLQKMSKLNRVMKEIEEYEDARDDWEAERQQKGE